MTGCEFNGHPSVARKANKCRKHLYSDIQPYSCYFEDCAFTTSPFQSRRLWENHLELQHGFGPDWKSFKCAFCLGTIEGGRKATLRHLSRHMEEIAIAALPQEIDSDAETESEDSPDETIPRATKDVPVVTLTTFKALHDFVGRSAGELSLSRDEIIHVTQKKENGTSWPSTLLDYFINLPKGWWSASRCDKSATGWVPSSYLEECVAKMEPPSPPRLASPIKSYNTSDSGTDVKSGTNSAPAFKSEFDTYDTEHMAQASVKPGPSSYWSISELQDFEKNVAHFGTDWIGYANHVGLKTDTMIKDQYLRMIESGRLDLEQAAKAADVRRDRGDDLGPPPIPTPAPKRRYESTQSVLPRNLALEQAQLPMTHFVSQSWNSSLPATISSPVPELRQKTIHPPHHQSFERDTFNQSLSTSSLSALQSTKEHSGSASSSRRLE